MSQIKRVLIVGGGVGGLTAAIALHRQGIQSEVVELNPEWSVYGVGIIQPSNMLRALREVGLGDACIANGRGFQGWKYCDIDGNTKFEAPSENVAGPGYPPVNGITRPALHKILTEQTLAQGTPVRLGVTMTAWEERADGISVETSDGRKETFDLVIAADGAYSKTREALFGAMKPRFIGEGVWRYNFERPRDLDWGAMFYGKKSKAGLVPLTESLMYLFLVTAEEGNPRMPADQLHHLLRDRLAEYGGIVGRLREQVTDPAGVVYRPMEVLALPNEWHKGRILLIGDAAHSGTPHLAEGAAMAIEDAVLLGQMLPAASSLEETLTAFTHRRRPRTQLVYETGLRLVEWEMAEFAGRPDPQANPGALFMSAYAELMKPI